MQGTQTKDCRELLAQEFLRRRSKNGSYSLRSFARDLKLSPAALSEVLNRKRELSKKNLLKVCEQLHLSPRERAYILASKNYKDLSSNLPSNFSANLSPNSGGSFSGSGEKGSNASEVDDSEFLLLKEDTFQLMSNWYYMAILSLAETQSASSEPSSIAQRLGIKEFEAKEALSCLLRLKFIEVVKDHSAARQSAGLLKRTVQQLTTSTDVPSSAIKKYHAENLKRAEESLHKDPVELRDMSSINMAVDPALLPEAKDMIKKFRRRLSRFLESGKKKEVYTIAIQLFPVSRQQNEERK